MGGGGAICVSASRVYLPIRSNPMLPSATPRPKTSSHSKPLTCPTALQPTATHNQLSEFTGSGACIFADKQETLREADLSSHSQMLLIIIIHPRRHPDPEFWL